MKETLSTTVRLTATEHRFIREIIRSGAAKNRSAAIRLALYEWVERHRVSQERTA